VRDVQCLAKLIEAVRLAVFWKYVLDAQPSNREQVAERVLAFATIEPPPDSAAFLLDAGAVRSDQLLYDLRNQGRPLLWAGLWLFFGRHLASVYSVMHQYPARKTLGVAKLEAEAAEVQVPFFTSLSWQSKQYLSSRASRSPASSVAAHRNTGISHPKRI
jgi:hypothetical protein